MFRPPPLVVCLWMLLAVLGPLASVQAQDLSIPPSPVSVEKPDRPPSMTLWPMMDAARAMEIGLPSIAAELYRKLLEDPAVTGKVRNDIVLELATALLEEERVSEAREALLKFSGTPSPAFRLRQAMIAAREKRFDAARAEVALLTAADLAVEDRAWLLFLNGLLAEEVSDSQSGRFYQQAMDAAISSTQRAWFRYAWERVKVAHGELSQKQIDAYVKEIEGNAGGPLSYRYVSLLAIAYNRLGQKSKAVDLLARQLRFLPPQERQFSDDWQLLLGMIAGGEDSVGRMALSSLISGGSDRDKQRAALRLLARESRAGLRREQFRDLLTRLIDSSGPKPLLEDLLLFRAQIAVVDKSDKRYRSAESDANRLLTEFPGSQLKGAALSLLAAVAWEQATYRAAANYATRARTETGMPPGETRSQLGVLIAEAYFRARDFRAAADAYGVALAPNGIPAGISAGMLMFQRVQAEIEAARLDESRPDRFAAAEALLDAQIEDPRFDVVHRWQAEWNLARALQATGDTFKAYSRVNRLLEKPAAGSSALPAALRAQLAWLQAKLSYDAGEFARTIGYAGALATSLDGVAEPLKTDVASNALLLEIRASIALPGGGAQQSTQELFGHLRAKYPGSDAAVYSYLIEADAAAERNEIVVAQEILRRLADDFRNSAYAPYALFQAASYAKRRAEKKYYEEAYKTLEDLVEKYPNDDLYFYARLEQGHLLRLIGDEGYYARARTIYEDLSNNNKFKFPQFPDGLAADLALADTLSAQVAADPANAGAAAAIYERLYDQSGAPPDLRVEAGFRLGLNLSTRDPERAATVWWRVINRFLDEEMHSAKPSVNRRRWLSKTIFELGELQRQRSKLAEAQSLYQLILSKGLPGEALARARLSLGTP